MNSTGIQTDYKSRMNRVFQYIDQNLNSNLSLKTVADVAFFSPFHFHRIFRSITGETLNGYITRRRVEKSAIDLLHSTAGITAITLNNGFSCNSAFTRTFTKFYGISPTRFRRENLKYSKISQLKSKNGQASPGIEEYLRVIDNLKNWTAMNARIEIRKMPGMQLAYISVIGPDNLGSAFQKLTQWGTQKRLMDAQVKLITIYHDSLKVTEEQKARMSACVTLKEPIEAEGEIGLTSIVAGTFVVGSYEIGLGEFEQSWTGLFIWMNENGYKKADGNPFEMYHNNFNEHPEKKCIVDFFIPVTDR